MKKDSDPFEGITYEMLEVTTIAKRVSDELKAALDLHGRVLKGDLLLLHEKSTAVLERVKTMGIVTE